MTEHDDQPDGAGRSRRPPGYRIGQTLFPARPVEPALYLIATPIGNLGDISLRALETLAGADIIACEDTRVSRVLLDRYGIGKRPVAYHEHNAASSGKKLMTALDEGQSVALISDAGTPLVSDPGYKLVETALAAGHRVIPIPGASAPMTALSAAGLPTDSFFFAGFLPQKEKARRDRLAELERIPGTLIFFESPHRVAACLADCVTVLGEGRGGVVCRELTKAYEEIRRGTLGELARHYAAAGAVKGEIVLLIAPFEAPAPALDDQDTLLASLLGEMPPAQAASEAARLTGLPRKALYQKLLAMKTN